MGKLTWLGEKMDRIREVFGDRGRHPAEGPFSPVLEAVRIKLKRLMLSKIGAAADEQARVAVFWTRPSARSKAAKAKRIAYGMILDNAGLFT